MLQVLFWNRLIQIFTRRARDSDRPWRWRDAYRGHVRAGPCPGSYLVKTPQALDTQKAMQFGTGGLTGMLCVLAVLDAGLKPADGPIAVSGAGGGVGGIATTFYQHLDMKFTQ